MASQLQLAQASWQYRFQTAYQPTRSHRGQPVEAPQLGHVEAQNWLGYSYQHGLGTEQSDASAVEWYIKAANSGLAAAKNNLGLMHLTGKGVPQDPGTAFALCDQAAKQGDVWGINNLGGLYEMGWGVSQDRQKALTYYKQASEQGIKAAAENLKRLSAALGLEPASASVEPIASLLRVARVTGGDFHTPL
jgi:TPR repeat protein